MTPGTPTSSVPFPELPGLEDRRPERLLAVLAHHPALTGPWKQFANAILEAGALSPRQREMLVLRTAFRRSNAYIWGGHVVVARAAGLTLDDVERITRGGSAPGWSPLDAALVDAVDELLDAGALSDVTTAALRMALDDRGMVEVALVVGNYVLVSIVTGTFRIEPEPWGAPLPGGDLPE